MSGIAPVRLAEQRASVQHRRRAAAAAVSVDLARAREALDEAASASTPTERYLAGQDAALRVAAVVLAVRARPTHSTRPPSTRPRNAWRLLAEVAPELAEWASFFATTGARRDAVRAGLGGVVRARESDDLLRDAGAFLALVEHAVAPPGPRSSRGAR